ncbi:MAG: hypothetical protein Q9160_005209 [Pyrenula sp. 1 TL-2023]
MPLINSESRGTETVTIFVGPEEKPYLLHKNLLITRCEYFRAAFGNGRRFTEGRTSEMKFPENDPAAFDLFVHWIYSASLPTLTDFPSPYKGILALSHFYIFADMILLPDSLKPKIFALTRQLCGLCRTSDNTHFKAVVRFALHDIDIADYPELRALLLDFAACWLCNVHARRTDHLDLGAATPLHVMDRFYRDPWDQAPEPPPNPIEDRDLMPFLQELLGEDYSREDVEEMQALLKGEHRGDYECGHRFGYATYFHTG